MVRNLNVVLAGLLALGMAGLPAPATALQRTLPAAKTATIVDDAGLSRMLVQFAPVTDLQQEWVVSATLHLPAGSTPLKESVDLTVDVPRTGWDAGATWVGSWTKPGGDPHDTQAVEWELPAGSSGGSLDVTGLVRAMAAGDLPDHGFLIYPSLVEEKAGFTASDVAGLGDAGAMELEIQYRKLSERRKAGAAEILDRRKGAREAVSRSLWKSADVAPANEMDRTAVMQRVASRGSAPPSCLSIHRSFGA